MDRRLSRRKLAIAIGALVLAVPGLSACGFNYATDREYTPGNGTNDQHGVVDVLNAVIVAERGRLGDVRRVAVEQRPRRGDLASTR